MNPDKIFQLKSEFDNLAHWLDELQTVEYWCARELQGIFGYEQWRNFELTVQRAMVACRNSGVDIADHFRHVSQEVPIGKGAFREIDDYWLTRYACYLVAQNGDPRKEEIAFAQSYFAIQTRRIELIQERLMYNERAEARLRLRESEKQLSQNIYERGVDDEGFGRIRSKGDEALFGGIPTAEMKHRLEMPPQRPLADFLPTLTIAAKNLATEMTNYNVEQQNMYGEASITAEHVQNNTSVRGMLLQRGIVPENLPAAEDFLKQERRAKAQDRKLAQKSPKFSDAETLLTLQAKKNDASEQSLDGHILAYLQNHGRATTQQLAEYVGMSVSAISRHASRMYEDKIIKREVNNKRVVWVLV